MGYDILNLGRLNIGRRMSRRKIKRYYPPEIASILLSTYDGTG